jgi:large subunit ribosomal protein L21
MQPYAVVESGGKQYRVVAGDTLKVETLEVDEGSTIDLTTVMAASDGTTLRIGKPTLEGVTVKASVVSHIRGEKVVSFKKKRRKGYSRKVGHRQNLTVLKVESIL